MADNGKLIYNIARNDTYKWTTTTGPILNEVPRIYANSHLIKVNDVLNQVIAFRDGINIPGLGDEGRTGIDYYDNLHNLTNAEISQWVFPYFGDEARSINTSWSDQYVSSTNGTQPMFSGGFAGAKKMADQLSTSIGAFEATLPALFSSGSPGSLYEPPKFYNYGELGEGQVGIEFSLINTLSEKDTAENYNLITKLISVNKTSRQAGFIVEPAAIWSVMIPGYRFIKWASANVNVKFIGQRKTIGNKIVPEGYRVSITFTSLYTEPREYEELYTSTWTL